VEELALYGSGRPKLMLLLPATCHKVAPQGGQCPQKLPARFGARAREDVCVVITSYHWPSMQDVINVGVDACVGATPLDGSSQNCVAIFDCGSLGCVVVEYEGESSLGEESN
jgi:hypothetical protein